MFRRYLGPYLAPDAGIGAGGGGDVKGELETDLSDIGEDDGKSTKDEGDADSEDEEDSADAKDLDEGDDEDAEEDGEDQEEDEEDQEEDEEEKPKSKDKSDEEEPGRVTFKTLKAEYPDLFKKHPELRTAFFEHPQYAEIFPDVSSAKEASVKAQEYDILERSMVGAGDPLPLITALDENNPKALKKIVAAFGEALRDTNPEYYTALATPIVEELLYHASRHAEKIGGDAGKNLRLAARHIANYVFANGGEIPDISARTKEKQKEPSEAERTLAQERAFYARREYVRAADDIEAQIKASIDPVYSNKLSDLTSFERKQVIKETRQEVDRLLAKDEAFQRSMKALWKRAEESGYSDASKTRIRRAWLERASVIAPKVRNRLRQEAISGRKKASEAEEETPPPNKKRQFINQGGKPAGKTSGSRDPKKIAWRSTSDMDILNS